MDSWPSIGGRRVAPVCWKMSAHMRSMMELMIITLVRKRSVTDAGDNVHIGILRVNAGCRGCLPFTVKLKGVLAKQRRHKLPDHSLGLLPLISSQHPHVGHQPGHRTYCHAAHFPLDVVSDLLDSKRGGNTKRNDAVSKVVVAGKRHILRILHQTAVTRYKLKIATGKFIICGWRLMSQVTNLQRR